MKRSLALAVAGLVLLVPGASKAWTQFGYDAASTGNVPGEGPGWPDLAFDVDLPGGLHSGYVVVDGIAYVATRDAGDGFGLDGVAEVTLDTAEVEPLVALEEWEPVALATDGDLLFLTAARDEQEGVVQARERSDGSLVWEWRVPEFSPRPEEDPRSSGFFMCWLALDGDRLYVSCTKSVRTVGQGESLVAALDARTGEAQWVWTTEDPSPSNAEEPRSTILWGLPSVVGDHVLLTGISSVWVGETEEVTGDGYGAYAQRTDSVLAAFDAEEGGLSWRFGVEMEQAAVRMEDGWQSLVGQSSLRSSEWATGEPGVVYVRLEDRVFALNPAQGGEELWSESVGEHDVADSSATGMPVLGEDGLFLATVDTLYRFDTEIGATDWRMNLDPARDEWFKGGFPVLVGDTIYALAWDRDRAGSTIYAIDQATGQVQWTHPISPRENWEKRTSLGHANHAQMFAEGVLIVPGVDASLRVLGETNASLVPAADPSTTYPAPGDELSVDLSGSEPGAFGDATRYKAIWGDGNETGWQSDPSLSHRYAQEGDVEARFAVGNDANQTASTTQTFHVGQAAPSEPNWLSERFESENQDMTFGVLGILVAVTGGAIGVARRYRERSRLQEELDAIEELYEETRGRPVECEAQLTERKAHTRGLLTDGYLTEEQFGVVENRIEELKRELRMSAVDGEFAFLPYSLVTALREMLEDGRVTRMEKDGFLTALEEDELIHPEQKAIVRERIDQWFARDSGGGGP